MSSKAPRKREAKRANAQRQLFDDNDDEIKEVLVSTVPSTASSTDPVSILDTPTKKRRLDDGGIQTFFSPKKGKAVVTPDKREYAIRLETPVKQKDEKKEAGYVPTHIHKNLSYQRRGQASLSETSGKTFELVEAHFIIPEDLEQNKSFGPLSGSCFEKRAIRAYNLSLLEPKEEGDAVVEICSNCATLGHKRNECPDLI
jgi:hypothetical protein